MDTQSKDILKQLLERLDKMDNQQHKLDRVMERLDTLQNIIEWQNQKQNLLDEKLVEMTIKRQQETAVMAEQLQKAVQEIVDPFRVTDSQGVSTPSPHMTTQPLQSLGTHIGDKLKSIEARTVDTSQKCYQLISWSRKMEDKMTELADNKVEMKTFLLEMRSVKDLIRGQTNSELIWFNSQIDKKLSDIGSVVRDIHQQQTEAKEETFRSTGQRVKTDMQHGNQGNTNDPLSDKQLSKEVCDKQMHVILNLDRKIEQLNLLVVEMSRDMKTSLDTILTTNKQSIIDLENTMSNSITEMNESSKEQSLSLNKTLKSDLNKTLKSDLNKHFEAMQSELQTNRKTVITESEAQTNRIITATETAKRDLRHLIKTEGDNTSKYKVEMESIPSLINSVLNCVRENMAAVVEKVDSTELSMIDKHQTVNATLEKLTTDLKTFIYETKREIFAVTEKEAQLVRDRIQGPLPSLGKYTFDFYVNNFKMLVRSGKELYSLPWHINETQTCVTGCVTMVPNGEMEVWLINGRHAREVGLQPRSGKTLKVKATISDICKKKLQPLNVGMKNLDLDETDVDRNGEEGCQVGVKSCDMLLKKGYAEEEGYCNGALLIRYEITVQ